MGGGVEFPYRGEWNDLNGDGEVTYDELGLEVVSGELDKYFEYDAASGAYTSSGDDPFSFMDYPSAYITFPSSVTSLLILPLNDFEDKGITVFSKTVTSKFKDIVFLGEIDFSEPSISLQGVGYDFSISLDVDIEMSGPVTPENPYFDSNYIRVSNLNDVNIYFPFSDVFIDMSYKRPYPDSFEVGCFHGVTFMVAPLMANGFPANLNKIQFSDNSNVKIDDGILYIDNLPYIPTGVNGIGNLETEGIEIAEGIEICILNAGYASAGILDYCYKTEGNLFYSILSPAYDSLPEISALTLPSSLKVISDEAFRYHYFEDEVFVIPDGVEYVGAHFLPSTSGAGIGIKYVYVPSSVTHLGRQFDSITIYKESDGYSLDDFAAEVGVTIPEGFIGGTLQKSV